MTHSYITNWLPKEDAQAKVKALIADGTYKKGEIKLSSYRWADLKDHSKGYVARVHVLTGIHPELELGLTGKRKKSEKTEVENVEEVQSDDVETSQLKIRLHGCVHDGELVQVMEYDMEVNEEQKKLILSNIEGQGNEIVLSYAEDLGVEEYNYYEVA